MRVSLQTSRVACVSEDVRTRNLGAKPGISEASYHYCISEVGSDLCTAPRNSLYAYRLLLHTVHRSLIELTYEVGGSRGTPPILLCVEESKPLGA